MYLLTFCCRIIWTDNIILKYFNVNKYLLIALKSIEQVTTCPTICYHSVNNNAAAVRQNVFAVDILYESCRKVPQYEHYFLQGFQSL